MRRPAGSLRRASAAALAFLFFFLVLVSLVVESGAKATPPISVATIGGRRMKFQVDAGSRHRTMEDFKSDDPFLSSKRRVPNGPDPIHNRGTGKSGRSPGRA